MTIRHALFIDGAWIEGAGDSWTALVMVDEMGIEIKPYIHIEGIPDSIRFTFEEFAAITDLVARAGQDIQRPEAAP